MKIEKGKLYYNHQLESVIIAVEDSNDKRGILSDKIAVHCPTREDWDYVVSKGYELTSKYYSTRYYSLNDNTHGYVEIYNNHGYKTISIDQFKQFYPESRELDKAKEMLDNLPDGVVAKFGTGGDMMLTLERGKKETNNKLEYELDFDFITQMAERMQSNKGKYEPYNWKKSMDVDKLKQALFRHVVEVMKGNYQDDGRLRGHIEAISCNAMMLNYQLKNK